jgi:hypothetical protein
MEQRYHAVMEVLSAGVPVVEVAERYGVSRNAVHEWISRYASGNVSVAGNYVSIGAQHAGLRITLRLEADLAHVVIDATLTKTLPLILTPTQRARLQGARMPGPDPQHDHRPTRTQRRTSARGTTMVIGQKIQVGLRHASRIVTIEINDTTLRVLDDHDELITTVPRTSRKELHRFKAYGKNTNHNIA